MNLARVAVLVGVFLAAGTAVILRSVPPPLACPGWHLRGSSDLPWVEFVGTVPFLAMACFVALRWDWSLRRAIEADEQLLLPAHYVLTALCIVGAAVAQVRLLSVIDCVARY
jgi:hypothetical protein